jgi:hypothetical protein
MNVHDIHGYKETHPRDKNECKDKELVDHRKDEHNVDEGMETIHSDMDGLFVLVIWSIGSMMV